MGKALERLPYTTVNFKTPGWLAAISGDPTYRSNKKTKVIPLTIGAWNVSPLIDSAGSDRPQQGTALVDRELNRYKVEIVAQGETTDCMSLIMALQRSNELYRTIKHPFKRYKPTLKYNQQFTLNCIFVLLFSNFALWLLALLPTFRDTHQNPGPDSVDSLSD